uniref:Uncharacterized protein n=1 Tax=Arundo donax TaxID=35708 RepID=A0A0A9AXP5_ARUDO
MSVVYQDAISSLNISVFTI